TSSPSKTAKPLSSSALGNWTRWKHRSERSWKSANGNWIWSPARSNRCGISCGRRRRGRLDSEPPWLNRAPPMSEVTRILSAIEQGDPHAAEQLLPLVYEELRKLAAAKL